MITVNKSKNSLALGELVDFISGFAFKSTKFNLTENGLPLIRIRDVVRGYSKTYYDGDYDDKYIVTNEDYLIGMDGEFNLSKWGGGKALLNQRVCKIGDMNNRLDRDYLARFLPKALKDIEDVTPFVTVKHLSVKQLREIKIPLPPLPEQKRIAGILDAADALRAKRRAALAQLDTLLQSTFLDLFGDPVTNPKGWEVVPMPEAVEGKYGVKAGPFGSALKKEDYTTSGYRIYGQEQVIAGRFDIGDYYIDQMKFEKLKACEVKTDDILVSLVGSYGKVLIVPSGIEPGIINPRLLKITPKQSKVTSLFLAKFIQNEATQLKLASMSHGGTMGILNAGLLKQLSVPLPPLPLQQRFAAIVEQVESQKARMRAQLTELDTLFAALQQRAFNGEF